LTGGSTGTGITGSAIGSNESASINRGVTVQDLYSLLTVAKRDNEVLLKKVSELQSLKWHADEKLRFLEENIVLLNEDIDKKSLIIKHHILAKLKPTGRQTPQMEQHKGMLNQLHRSAKVREKEREQQLKSNPQIYQQMEAAMEETILKNLQLQNDLDILGNEIMTLNNQNKNLIHETQTLREKLSKSQLQENEVKNRERESEATPPQEGLKQEKPTQKNQDIIKINGETYLESTKLFMNEQ